MTTPESLLSIHDQVDADTISGSSHGTRNSARSVRRQPEVLVEEDRQRHADGELEGQRRHGEHDGVRQRRHERRVVEDLAVVVEAGERARRPGRTSARCSRAGSGRGCGRAGRRRTRAGRSSPGRGTPRRPTARARRPAVGAIGGPAVERPRPPPTGSSVCQSWPSALLRRLAADCAGGQRGLRRLRAAEGGLHRGPQRLGDLRVLGAEVVAGAALGGLDRVDPDLQLRRSRRPACACTASVGAM